MLGLTSLGVVHTAISLVALFTGAASLIRYKNISLRTLLGKIYVLTTVLTCVTGFGIFQHGGFNKAHALGVITLFFLFLAWAASKPKRFKNVAPYIETVSYSLTFFFHLVPGLTETATRLPVGAPLAANDQAPGLQAAIGTCFLLFLLGATWQILRLRKSRKLAAPVMPQIKPA